MTATSGFQKLAAAFSVAALALGTGCAEKESADPNAAMREIYYLSDLPGQVDPLERYAEQALAQQQAEFTPVQFEIAREVIARELGAKNVEQAVLQRLAEQSQREHLDAALAWLKRPEVAEIMRAKSTAWSTEGQLEMKAFFEGEGGEPPPASRQALIERYDAATNTSALAAETMLLSAYAVAVMHDALKPPDEQQGPAKLRDAMAAQRNVLKPIFKATSSVSTRFAFRNLTDDEIEEFLEFVESPPGQWLYATTSTSFLNGLLGITANLGGVYVAKLPPQARSIQAQSE
jgi:hypothetical protein